jgi:hypothetical protein
MTYEFKLLSKASPFLHGLISNQKEFEVDRPYVLKEIDKIEYIQMMLCRVSGWTIQFFVSSLIKKAFCVMYEEKHDITTYTWRWKSKYVDMEWKQVEKEFQMLFGKQIQERNKEHNLSEYEASEIWQVLKCLHEVIEIADTFEIK